ncbi:hypothetical protein ISS37_00965 [candidate division KSB1 bacterium]|nr:hypothetical protein [candidate division KSB1 bacterium]
MANAINRHNGLNPELHLVCSAPLPLCFFKSSGSLWIAKRLSWLILALLVFWGCSERERTNPLDPLNPETDGKPTGLRLVSDKRKVTVEWDDISVEGMLGYRIFRKCSGQTEFDTFSVVGKISQYADSTVFYDTIYTYWITALTEGYESPPSPFDSIRPGPFNYWVADSWGWITKITYDGSHLFPLSIRFSYPVAIAAYRRDTTLWVADYFAQQVIKIDKNGKEMISVELTGWPLDLSVDQSSEDCWVALKGGGTPVVRLDRDGGLTKYPLSGLPCSDYLTITVDSQSGWAWLADEGEGRVIRISPSPSTDPDTISVDSPISIAVYSDDGICWVGTRTGLFRINGGVEGPILSGLIMDVAVNDSTGDCWAIRYQPGSDPYGVWQVYPAGEDSIKVLDYPYWSASLAVNPSVFHQGILLADAYWGRVIRFDGNGREIGSLTGFDRPVDVDVE